MTVLRADVSLPGAWRYWLRNATVFRRTWLLGLTAWFLEPVVYLVAMGTGLGQYLRQVEGIDYIDFIAPGLLAVSAMYGATFEVSWNTFFKMDRARVYDAVSATPVSLGDIALGESLWGATRSLVYGGAFAVVATPFGVFKSWWALLAAPGLALVGLTFALIGLTYTYLVKRIDYLAYYWTMFLTPMFMFSGIFFPLERLPDWVEALAWCTPLYHGAEMFRALALAGDPAAAAAHAAWLGAVCAALVLVPPVILRRRLAR